MKFLAHEFYQNEIRLLSTVMTVSAINANSKVLIYGQDKYGYQREPDQKHIEKIKNNILNDGRNTLLPTSIILSVDENKINKIQEEFIVEGARGLFILDLDKDVDLFRVVDGQHRLKGLKEACKFDDTLEGFELNVIILVIPQKQRAIEVKVFKDINSTAKKLKTDLIELVNRKYILLGESPAPINDIDVIAYICLHIANLLNEDRTFNNSIWHNAIINIGEEKESGVIGSSAFVRSIIPFVKFFYNRSNLKEMINQSGNEQSLDISKYDDFSFELANYIDELWGKVESHWSDCFGDTWYSELFNNKFNENYYVQKTTGTNAIMRIVFEELQKASQECEISCLKNKEGRKNMMQEVKNAFDVILRRSPISEKDWKVGGDFAGLTSGSGFKKAATMIRGEE